ncbi:MAG: hypothetical protein V4702_01120 [Patescibacteria group bacterium]
MSQGEITKPSKHIKHLTFSHKDLILLSQRLERLEQAIYYLAQETGVKLKFDF